MNGGIRALASAGLLESGRSRGIGIARREPRGSPILHPVQASRFIAASLSRQCTGTTPPARSPSTSRASSASSTSRPTASATAGGLRTVDDARRHIDRLVAEGADVIDIGGESTRPQGATPVERRRGAAREWFP